MTHLFVVVAAALISTSLGFGQTSSAVSCPETAPASTPEGWSASGGRSGDRAPHPLNGVSVANTKGSEVYDLAPDDEKKQGTKIVQIWKLTDYREMNIRLSCRYKDTSLLLSRDLPASLRTCTFTFELDAKANVTGKPTLVCK